jgi:hypothetical protein
MDEAFACSNTKYKTNTSKGFPHGEGNARGSVTEKELDKKDGYTLWFEHVVGIEEKDEAYWFMWYNSNGKALIKQSAVIGIDVFSKIVEELIKSADFYKKN